jgi:hypothetical protein
LWNATAEKLFEMLQVCVIVFVRNFGEPWKFLGVEIIRGETGVKWLVNVKSLGCGPTLAPPMWNRNGDFRSQ